eukprot:scaffold18371_cov56-Attheya_sp.AAC.7
MPRLFIVISSVDSTENILYHRASRSQNFKFRVTYYESFGFRLATSRLRRRDTIDHVLFRSKQHSSNHCPADQ